MTKIFKKFGGLIIAMASTNHDEYKIGPFGNDMGFMMAHSWMKITPTGNSWIFLISSLAPSYT